MTLLRKTRKPARRKALLAIAFAGGMLNSQLPALSKNFESTDSVIQQIENSTEMAPEIRAFNLLNLARSYLAGGDRTARYIPSLKQSMRDNGLFRKGSERILVPWAEQLSSEEHSMSNGSIPNTEVKSNAQSIPREDLVLADAATEKAVIQLDNVSDTFAKLNMYFIAARLFQKTGNTDGMRKCNKVVEEAIVTCEGRPSSGEDQLRAAASILNLMAYGFIPVHIPDELWRGRQREVKPFSEHDFKESEKLQLRAVALLDRLSTTDHLRRKAHRDLALWYTQLGKNELAEKEKLVLFELVGSNDDSILYPQSTGCGHLVWWETKDANPYRSKCGMG